MTPDAALTIIKNTLQGVDINAFKAFREPSHEAIKAKSAPKACVFPGGFTSNSPPESSGGRLGTFRFIVRMYADPKSDIEGDNALELLLNTYLTTILTALCCLRGDGTNNFNGEVFFTGFSEPGKTFTAEDEFLRHCDYMFSVKLGI